MKLYFNKKLIEMEWNTLMKPNEWYSWEPAILKVKRIHQSDYHRFLKSRKNRVTNIVVHKLKSDFPPELEYQAGLFDIEILVNRCTVTSKYRDGYLDIIIDVCVMEMDEKDKSELRDILLENLIYS